MTKTIAALLVGASLSALACALPAAAQAPTAQPIEVGGRTAYPVAFFADSQASNAYEILQRVPGFTLDEGDSGVRGFAGAGGNVLIDGERPASKSVSLEDLLRRIPVTAIERIELVRAGDATIDLQGQSLVANIVRRADSGGSLAVTLGLKRYSDGKLGPQFAIEGGREIGAWQLEGAIRGVNELDTDSGTGRRVTLSPAGVVLRDHPLSTRERGPAFTASGGATLRREIDTIRLNIGGEYTDDTGIDTLDRQRTVETSLEKTIEFGGDYERTLSSTLTGKLVALQTLESVLTDERSVDPGGVETSQQDEKSGESILRGSLEFRPSSTLSFEGGAEGAFNWLESSIAVTEDGRPAPIPNDNVRIEETRAEGFITSSWTVSEKLSVEGALRVEASKISQTGDTSLSRNFFFPKPRATLSYKPNAATNIRLRFEREVGQLNFGDFAASSDLALGSVSAGNARLEPERAWVVEAAFERRFWGEGAIVLTLTHEWVDQVVDRLPINGQFDGPGNIGDGTRDQAEVTIALPLDRLGVPGGRIAGEGFVRRSKVTDPVTGVSRRISNETSYGGTFNFSQDLPNIASTWGVEVDVGGVRTSYRIDEIRRDKTDPYWSAYWEWKPQADLSIRVQAENFTGREFKRRRTLFDGPRTLNVIEALERRETELDPFLFVRVRKQF
jgi:hypothetical protein